MSEKITHALISVTDKEGIVEFTKNLIKSNIAILSTGGTAQLLKEHNIPVQEIADFTGFPEMMGGRVKTLHPKLYGGILARTEMDDEILKDYNIPLIGLVVVNLYPFQQVTAREDCSFKDAIENIDIGGPTLLRAAAKNFERTTAIVSKKDYATVAAEILKEGNTSSKTRFELAKKVFAHVAEYDATISNYFSGLEEPNKKVNFPTTYTFQIEKKMDLRYGENPHQSAAFYINKLEKNLGTLSHASLLSGKPLSYNNIADADAALECVKQFKKIACVIVKHANPCAVSLGNTQLEAYEKAFTADATSAFGGVIAFNRLLETDTAKRILDNQFVEVIIAPDVAKEALNIFAQKPNVRILTTGQSSTTAPKAMDLKSITGGMLIQERDNQPTPLEGEIVTVRQPTPELSEDLLFAWQVVRFVKSNAIVLAKNLSTFGIGPGQMSRVFSTKIAALKAEEAGLSLLGAVMASDAFFPFRDSVDEAAALGISAIIQPGGSIRDKEVIQAADEHNIVMIFTHIRHFRH